MTSAFSYSIAELSHKYKKNKFCHTEVSNKTSFSLKLNDKVQDYFLYKLCFYNSELIVNL